MEFANVTELNVRNSLGRFKKSLHITLYNIYLPVYYQCICPQTFVVSQCIYPL